ncbi:hypothetical protein TPR58_20595 [Sphingomonas sp. HF-S3]|uniref:Uncharacterized protein n=1 Tax=Sphingomonas rustica TaxID=3103142 RepID=A0ABV0BDJ6_9SPHN
MTHIPRKAFVGGQLVDAAVPPGEGGAGVADPLDRDGDGRRGGSLPRRPAALSGLRKAELLAVAAADGVAVAPDATVAAIRRAIEVSRGR